MSKGGGSTFVVAAIDFGTTYSGYAYSFKTSPKDICLHKWDKEDGGAGLKSLKTPTTLLLRGVGVGGGQVKGQMAMNPNDNDYEFVAFGEDAEKIYLESWEEEKDNLILIRRFKMELHTNPSLDASTKVSDVSGKVKISAKRIITMGVKYLKGEIMKAINQQQNKKVVNEDDVLFVLTVPAVWDDRAKLLMREAAIDAGIDRKNLAVALESEAASVWCQTIPLDKNQTTVSKKGTKYMTVDLGGGTADITVHEALGDGALKSVFCPGGGTWGGTTVDNNFLHILGLVFGQETVKEFKSDHVGDYLELMREFETTKRLLTSDRELNLAMKLPASFLEIARKNKNCTTNQDLQDEVKNSAFQDKLKLTRDKFYLSPFIGKQLFDYTVKSLSKHIKNLLAKPIMDGLTIILTVGGFADCDIVQSSLRERFTDKTLIFPPKAGLVVLKGAVLYGHTPNLVSSRVTQLTYGFQVAEEYDQSKHGCKDAVVETIEGRKMCTNVFSILIPKDTNIKAGEASPLVQDKPLRANQTKQTFLLFTSDQDDPQFTSHFSCSKIGKFEVPVPRGGDVNDKVFERQVVFGDVELLFKLTYLKTKEYHEQYFNFS